MRITITDRYQGIAHEQGLIPSVSLPGIVLWHRVLKNHQLAGLHFERIDNSDSKGTVFICLDIPLVIMLTSASATTEASFDNNGNRILYFNQKQVLYSIDYVKKEIETTANLLKKMLRAS